MAGHTAILAIRIIGDAKGATGALDRAATRVDKFKSGLTKAAVGSAVVLGGLAKLGKGAYDAASDLQQSAGGIDAVFGKSAKQMHRWAASAATSFGLSKNSANEFAAVLGAQLKNAGTPIDQVSAKTKKLVGLGSDLAATYGGSTSDAVAALSSALKGEMDPIEKYGISLNQAQLKVQALKMGIKGSSTTWTTAQKQQIILAALTKQSTDAQGQFAKQINTAAERQQIAAAKAENLKAKLGTALLPIVTRAVKMFGRLADWVSRNSQTATVLVTVIGGLAAGIILLRGVITAWEVATKVAAAAQWAWNAAMDANPIGMIIAAIGALIAVIVLVVTHWKQIAAVAKVVWAAVVSWVKTVIAWIGKLIHGWLAKVVNWWAKVKLGAQILWAAVVAGVKMLIGWLRKLVGSYIARVRGAFQTLGRIGKAIWGGITGGIKSVINWLKSLWHGTIEKITSAFRRAGDIGKRAFQGVVDTIRTIVGWAQTAIGWVGKLFGAQSRASTNQANLKTTQAVTASPQMMTRALAAAPTTTRTAGTMQPLASTSSTPVTSLLQIGSRPVAPTVVEGDTYEFKVTVNGAIDKVGTGRTVIDTIDAYLRAIGKKPAAGGPKVVIA